MGITLVLVGFLMMQDATGDLLAALRGDDDEAREGARYGLTRLDPSAAPALRKMLPFHPDVRGALEEAIPKLYDAWGWELYRSGKLDEALDCFAEAAGARDVKKYVRDKLSDAQGFIERWMPVRHGCLPGSEHLDCSDCPGLVKSIKGCFGPWGVAVVVHGTRGGNPRDLPYDQLLAQMGDDVVPVLCRELESPVPHRRGWALVMMDSVFRHSRTRPTQLWVTSLRAVADRPSESEENRRMAEDLWGWLKGNEK